MIAVQGQNIGFQTNPMRVHNKHVKSRWTEVFERTPWRLCVYLKRNQYTLSVPHQYLHSYVIIRNGIIFFSTTRRPVGGFLISFESRRTAVIHRFTWRDSERKSDDFGLTGKTNGPTRRCARLRISVRLPNPNRTRCKNRPPCGLW